MRDFVATLLIQPDGGGVAADELPVVGADDTTAADQRGEVQLVLGRGIVMSEEGECG